MATKNINLQTGPSYLFLTGWEENFDAPGSIESFKNNWHLPYIFSILIYLPALYIGQKVMQNREPFNLRVPLMFWNGSLAAFSIIGFTRCFPELVYTFNKFGFHHTICNSSYVDSKPCCFWVCLFALSKIPELLDTIFLVLKKQRLIFLHVYHHATVLIFSWFMISNALATSRWMCTMNLGVHSIMYTYYLLKGMPNFVKIPKWVSMIITALQSIQMIMGAYVAGAAFYTQLSGRECKTSTSMSIFGLLIYASYLYLFSQFFFKAYCSPPPKKDGKSVIATDKKRA